MNNKKGPDMIWVCGKCDNLNTFTGTVEDHHTCPAGGWKSIKQTKIGESPITPETCPYLENNNIYNRQLNR